MATSTQQKQELFKAIWAIAEDLRNKEGLFGNAGAKRAEKKKSVFHRIKDFFDRFFDISGGNFFNPDED